MFARSKSGTRFAKSVVGSEEAEDGTVVVEANAPLWWSRSSERLLSRYRNEDPRDAEAAEAALMGVVAEEDTALSAREAPVLAWCRLLSCEVQRVA